MPTAQHAAAGRLSTKACVLCVMLVSWRREGSLAVMPRPCLTDLLLAQAPPAAARALRAVPGPSLLQVRGRRVGGLCDRHTGTEALVWDVCAGCRGQRPYVDATRCCLHVSARVVEGRWCGWCAATRLTSGVGRQARRRARSAAQGRTQAPQVCGGMGEPLVVVC